MIRTLEVERFALTSTKTFDEVVAAVKASTGTPDAAAFGRAMREAPSEAELEAVIRPAVSKAGLMLFLELDEGMIVRMSTDRHTSKIVRLLIGNPLIMKVMAKHVPDAGSYAPVTVLLDERDDGVHLSYDRMASFLAPYGNRDALSVARELDMKVEDLLRQAAD
jgi:uncharacterized protein (DUF302 family)